MTQTDKEKNKIIDEILEGIKLTLRKTYLGTDLELYQGGLFAMQSFQNGNFSRTGKGKKEMVKIQLGFNPKQFVNAEKTGLPMKMKDWRVIPLTMLIWQEKPDEDEI